jgi:hypothetical protein
MNDQFPQEHVNKWENNQFRPDSVITPEPVEYQPDNVITAQPDQNQPEVNTLENEHFYDKPIETPLATAEAVQDAASLQEKTEPWKQPVAPVSTFTPTPPPAPVAQVVVNATSPEILFGIEETKEFRARWNEVQAKFVDEPGSSVREADTLVAEVMAKITEMFANQRSTLESQWSKGDTSTEELRQVLQHYRTFFNRLLK